MALFAGIHVQLWLFQHFFLDTLHYKIMEAQNETVYTPHA